jgi:hypothetical protein
MENEQQIIEQPSALEALERANVDIRIATARKFRRPINTKVIAEQIILQATRDEETAHSCYYSIPRRQKQPDGSYMQITLQGPSVRLSEIIATAYGNLDIAGRIIGHDYVTKTISAQAYCWDLENNIRRTAEWSEPIVMSSSDGIKMTKLAAISKSERNAILKVVPRAIWQPALDRVITTSVGDLGSLQDRLHRAIKKFASFGVFQDRILQTFNVKSVADLSQGDLANLLGMWTALSEQTATVDELFPRAVKEKPELEKALEKSIQMAESEEEKEAPKRRGRPRKEDVNLPERLPNLPFTEVGEPKAESLEDEAKGVLITEIRNNLKRDEKTEGRLLAVLSGFSYFNDREAALDNLDYNALSNITKRWGELLKHL